MKHIAVASIVVTALALSGCDSKSGTQPPANAGGDQKHTDDHKHDDGHKHDDDHKHTDGDKHDEHGGHGEGPMMSLGEAKAGDFVVKADRQEGAIAAGKEVAFDLNITGAAKATAVRLWIGTQDAKGSMKVKGELEDPNDPNVWHAHVEAPDPLPQGSQLWVEIESAAGKSTVGIALKM